MMFETFLLELAKVLHFPTLAPDDKGACLIIMKEGDIPLLFELDEKLVPNKILVSTPVIDFSIDRRSEIYEMCLTLNSKCEETLSVRPDEDLIYLHRRIAAEIQAAQLEIIVQGFLAQVDQIKKHVEELLKKVPKHLTIPPHPFPNKV